MTRFFYSLTVEMPEGKDQTERFFRIPSGLDFPAPIGTDIFLMDDRINLMDYLEVTSYCHVLELWPSAHSSIQVGDFHSRLDTNDLRIDMDAFAAYLLAKGWEEVSDFL